MKVKVLHTEGARTAPVVFCEICHTRVEKGDHAEYLIPHNFSEDREGQYSDIVVGHTKCTKEFEMRERAEGRHYGNMSLDNLIYSLVANQGVDLESEAESRKIAAGIG